MSQQPELATKNVAIIGAGLAGLVSLKECLAAGHTATVFEARPEIGGQWAHQPVSSPSSAEVIQSSMYDSAQLNSCRDTSAFSDFPYDPARYPDYFSHELQLQYIKEYAAHFGLLEHVQLCTRVVSTQPEGEGWIVQTHKVAGDGKTAEAEAKVIEHRFDAVYVCSGHHTKPLLPEFNGRDKFEGEFMHSHFYRAPGPFKGKKVVVIGIGSSAVDIAAELVDQATEVHVITRRGGWVIPKWVLGKPTEAWDNRATQIWLPLRISQWLQTCLLNMVAGPHPPELKPAHRLLEQNATLQQSFMPLVKKGKIKVHRAGIVSLGPHSVSLSNDTTLSNVDAIIACTGYVNSLPFLSAPHDSMDLYKLVLSRTSRSLFFIGFLELFGPLPPTAEAQARWSAAVLSGRIKLPDQEVVDAEIAARKKMRQKMFIDSPRHDRATFPVEYIDDLLSPLGANPTAVAMLKMGFSIWNAVYMSLTSPAQWRLTGVGAKERLARETVLRTAAGKKEMSKGEKQELGLAGDAE